MGGQVLSHWTTVRATAGAVLSVTQDADQWLDVGDASDVAIWLDVVDVASPSLSGGSVSLHIESAPTPDEMAFGDVCPPIVLATSSSPIVRRSVRTPSTQALSKIVRWRLDVPNASSGLWSATFRIRAVPLRSRSFVPTDIAGCEVWLRSDLGLTFNSGNVSTWKDQSGQGHDCSQGTSTRQPAYNVSPINGIPTLFFDASTAGSEKIFSMAGSLAGLTAGHVFFVAKSVNALPPAQSRTGIWNLGGAATASHLPYLDSIVYDSFGSNTRYTEGAAVVTITNPFYYEVRASSSSWNSFMNGISQFSTTPNTVAWSGTLELGGNSPVGVFYDGHLAELLIYSRVLAGDDLARVQQYIKRRYALV
jgi:hypothetical protein